MSGHQAIAQAALQGSGLDNDSAAEVPEQTREALSSLLQETQVRENGRMTFAFLCKLSLVLHPQKLCLSLKASGGVEGLRAIPGEKTILQQLK